MTAYGQLDNSNSNIIGAMHHRSPPGWRQLPWPVDDNYLGRLRSEAGPVREAGLT